MSLLEIYYLINLNVYPTNFVNIETCVWLAFSVQKPSWCSICFERKKQKFSHNVHPFCSNVLYVTVNTETLCVSWSVCVCVCVCVWERERERPQTLHTINNCYRHALSLFLSLSLRFPVSISLLSLFSLTGVLDWEMWV